VTNVGGIDSAAYILIVCNLREWWTATATATATATSKAEAINASSACPFTLALYENYNLVNAGFFLLQKLYLYQS
jgi:hypothetical protein